MSGKPKDLVGQKIGMLTVIKDSGERDKNGGHVMWGSIKDMVLKIRRKNNTKNLR